MMPKLAVLALRRCHLCERDAEQACRGGPVDILTMAEGLYQRFVAAQMRHEA